jgi:alpha-mannosidase
LAGQFHDIYAGTATPKAYQYSWNDDVIALNQFSGIVTSASGAVASLMNTETGGVPVVVYNPLSIARSDVVRAVVPSEQARPAGVRVTGPDGRAVPAQMAGDTVLFLASVPSVGYAVYDVQASATSDAAAAALAVSDSMLENARYRVRIDRQGDIASVYDKTLQRELLSAPMRLAFQTEWPTQYPAWNMDWKDQRQPPRAYVGGPATIRVVERGPARVAVEVRREGDSSTFVETVRLAAGDAGNRIEIANAIDWRTEATALKATLPLGASNREATYNWEVGTIRRATNTERQFEMASHQWVDLTDTSGRFGVTVLTDGKNGSDKPDDRTLRLTLIYTPGVTSANEPFS